MQSRLKRTKMRGEKRRGGGGFKESGLWIGDDLVHGW